MPSGWILSIGGASSLERQSTGLPRLVFNDLLLKALKKECTEKVRQKLQYQALVFQPIQGTMLKVRDFRANIMFLCLLCSKTHRFPEILFLFSVFLFVYSIDRFPVKIIGKLQPPEHNVYIQTILYLFCPILLIV